MKSNQKNLFFLLFLIFFCALIKADLNQLFEKKLQIENKYMNSKEFFEFLSGETGIKFLMEDQIDFKIKFDDYQNKPIKTLLKHLEDMTFEFFLKFDKEEPYILVKIKREFKERASMSEKIDVNFEGAPLKEVFATFEEMTGKKIILKNPEILKKKSYLKFSNIEWEDFLKKLSEENKFNYEIKENEIIIF